MSDSTYPVAPWYFLRLVMVTTVTVDDEYHIAPGLLRHVWPDSELPQLMTACDRDSQVTVQDAPRKPAGAVKPRPTYTAAATGVRPVGPATPASVHSRVQISRRRSIRSAQRLASPSLSPGIYSIGGAGLTAASDRGITPVPDLSVTLTGGILLPRRYR